MTRSAERSDGVDGFGARAATAANAVLVAEGFGRRYHRFRPWAVRNLSLTLTENSITALVGPNGAGKSTFVRACVGLERPDEGRIVVANRDSVKERAAAVKQIAYVPQSAALYRSLTIADHVTMAQVARPSFDPAVALEIVAAVGLSERRRVGELSGGEQAQVALAIATGIRAPLFLLDEPLASLDPLARREFMSVLVRDVRERRATALVSSHIVADVEPVADRIAAIASGRLVLDASLDEVRTSFGIVPADTFNGPEAIGVFADPSGERVALVDRREGTRPATLEEVVLGHLAGAKRDRPH